jgi:hypothetical protein
MTLCDAHESDKWNSLYFHVTALCGFRISTALGFRKIIAQRWRSKDTFNPLLPNCYFMYHESEHSEILPTQFIDAKVTLKVPWRCMEEWKLAPRTVSPGTFTPRPLHIRQIANRPFMWGLGGPQGQSGRFGRD